MLETEGDLLHRELVFKGHTGSIEQDKPGHEAQDEMAIVGVFPLHLGGFRHQEMFQHTEVVFNPAPPLPGTHQAGCGEGRGLAGQIVAVLARFVDERHGDRPVRRAGRRESDIAHPCSRRSRAANCPRSVQPSASATTRRLFSAEKCRRTWRSCSGLATAPVRRSGEIGLSMRCSPSPSNHTHI
jgi:hypothetical protein